MNPASTGHAIYCESPPVLVVATLLNQTSLGGKAVWPCSGAPLGSLGGLLWSLDGLMDNSPTAFLKPGALP